MIVPMFANPPPVPPKACIFLQSSLFAQLSIGSKPWLDRSAERGNRRFLQQRPHSCDCRQCELTLTAEHCQDSPIWEVEFVVDYKRCAAVRLANAQAHE